MKARRTAAPVWRQATLYGILLAAGTFALQWFDYQRLARTHSNDIYIALIAGAFLAIGVAVGMRIVGTRERGDFDGNPAAQNALGISPRELAVLHELAAGRSNKEIAIRLSVSPNTVKTHIARLYEKLGAARRTEAVNKARALGLLP